MDRFHPELDHGVTLAELDDAVAQLSASVPEANDDELLTGVMRIVAMVSAHGCDGHLGAFAWGTGTYPVDSLPLRLWLFDDGVYIVDALAPHEDLVGSRLESLNGRPMAEVLATIDPIVPRDNDQTVRLLMPRFLLMPQVLRGVGLIGEADAPITVELRDDSDGSDPREVSVNAIPMAEYNAWAGAYGLHLPEAPDLLYLSRIGDDLWWQKLNDGSLFVQYNRVERRFLGDLAVALADPTVERVTLDLRHNFGGEVPVVDEILPLFREWDADHPGNLFVVTGRNTLSAGSLFTTRLHDYTSATIVGEPMGGCATFWGDVEPLNLPYSGIQVSVPTMLEVGTDPDDRRLTIEPDIPAPLTPEAWAAGDDPGPRSDLSGGARMTDENQPLSSPSIFFEVYALGQAVRRLLAEAMADSPLTPEEYAIYSAIFEDELLTPTRMARRLGLPLTTTMDHVARLEARGHVRRTVSAADRRATVVSLTASGLAAHREANRFFERAYDLFVRALAVDEATATTSLAVIRDAVEAVITATQRAQQLSPRRPRADRRKPSDRPARHAPCVPQLRRATQAISGQDRSVRRQ